MNGSDSANPFPYSFFSQKTIDPVVNQPNLMWNKPKTLPKLDINFVVIHSKYIQGRS